jgi:Capsule polysaccharide biosynthesis protein
LLADAGPVLRAQQVPLVVKNHPQEDPETYARLARASAIADLVTVLPITTPIFALLAAARAAIVLTSTVGLEALAFGLPIGVLEIPGFAFAFEYVQRGAAVPLTSDSIAAGVTELLAGAPARRAAGQALLERHLYDRGRARTHVADVIERVLAMTDPS